MYRSVNNIQASSIDYKNLYLQEKKLKQQYQKRAEIAQIKNRKLSHRINKKCYRCSSQENKDDRVSQLKEFKLVVNSLQGQENQKNNGKLIENFAVFGSPESVLTDPEELCPMGDGELLFVSDYPSEVALHSAKLAFPEGNNHIMYHGSQARQKAIQIMSSNVSLYKSFIMSYESDEIFQADNEIIHKVNPDSRLYAICLRVEEFTAFTSKNESQQEVEKMVQQKLESSLHASCESTDAGNNEDMFVRIVTSSRIYCVFSKYPFFSFYEELIKSMIGLAKTERLVMYRESGCSIAEADSHFFLARLKEIYNNINEQIDKWDLKLHKQLDIKMITCQKLSLVLSEENCRNNFIQFWGLPILRMFTVEAFVEVFTLVMLEEKVVFVGENPYLLTYAVHLFTRLLPRPFMYPYPSVNILPNDAEFLNAPFPVVYGLLMSKEKLIQKSIPSKYSNTYIVLNRNTVEIISKKKSVLKKVSMGLKQKLTPKFKAIHESLKRSSSLILDDDNLMRSVKDTQGFSMQVLNDVYGYLVETFVKNLPSEKQMEDISQKVKQKLGDKSDPTQEMFREFIHRYKDRVSDPFYSSFLGTQLLNSYLFK